MEKTRTLAIQIPEELFQRVKDYLQRNNMTQRQFLIGLIEDELDREMTEREGEIEAVSEEPELEDEYPIQDEEAVVGDFTRESEEVFEEEATDAPQESYPAYEMGMSM